MTRPLRSLVQKTRKPVDTKVRSLHKQNNETVIWGSDHHANFIDVISIAPITGIKELFINDVNIKEGEYKDSTFFQHNGDGESTPWDGKFPYVERTETLNKQSELKEEGKKYSNTIFNRAVSGLGVSGIRVNFTTSGFTHKDNKNRNKTANAKFIVKLLNKDGDVVKTVLADTTTNFHATSATAVQATLMLDDQDFLNHAWSYEVEMQVRYNYYGTAVNGNWTASTVTELYHDTQTYDKIAYCSGDIIAAEVAGKTPKRQYLVEGYKVLVPVFTQVNGRDVFTGQFTRETSDSYAWNILAVLTDTVWGGKLPLDRINLINFLDFHRYCQTEINGIKRYSHSQALVKAENYFKLASQIAGAADGKLFEDTTGRLGILVDKETPNRRVMTSYDLIDEKVKRTTVPLTGKINHVEAEFDDKSNNYKKTLIELSDFDAITNYGVITKKIKLDTCTDSVEANRTIKKVLAVSQVATTSYMLKGGHSHDDVQIGDVIELYDRKFARANYCGKIADGSTTTVLVVDKRTPIDLSMFSDPQIVIDNLRGIPIIVDIQSWTETLITLSTALDSVPNTFTSFAVKDSDPSILNPELVRVIGTSSTENGATQIEGIAYNHSLYSHVENDTPIIIPTTQNLPPSTSQIIGGLVLSSDSTGITATWDEIPDWNYHYFWRRFDSENPLGITIKSGELSVGSTSTKLPAPLNPLRYTFSIYATKDDASTTVYQTSIDLGYEETGNSALPAATGLGVKDIDGNVTGGYTGRDFTLAWEQDTALIDVNAFIIRITQSASTLEKRVTGDKRSVFFSESELINHFGIEYTRSFDMTVIAVDINLVSNASAQRLITNTPPIAPLIEVKVTGDVNLSGTRPNDAVGSTVIVWKGTDLIPPSNAFVFDTEDLSEINIPDDVVVYDSSTYTFMAAWVDSFGKTELVYDRKTFVADPDILVPESPELLEVIGIKEDRVIVNFTHSGSWFRRLKMYFRMYGNTDWIEVSNVHTFPSVPEITSSGFDPITGLGFVVVTGLVNSEYEFKATCANITSQYSDDSNIVRGTPLYLYNPEDILNEISEVMGGIDPRDMIAEGVVDAFETIDLDDTIIKETIEKQITEGKMIADLDRLSLVVETELVSSKATATSFKQLVATQTSSILKTVNLLETSFIKGLTEANTTISSFTEQLSEEKQARITQGNAIAVELNLQDQKRTADKTEVTQLIADETQARATEVQTLNVAVVTVDEARVADKSEVTQLVANESQTRATQINTLNTAISGNTNEIANVKDSQTAAIGYCTISSNTTAHNTKALCLAATGTWVEAPLAEAVRQVQVTSGGETSTVGSMYETMVAIDGKITGKATIGVTAGGTFTGLEVVGGSNFSKMSFQAGGIEFKNSAGTKVLEYVSDNWIFSGHLSAATGSFGSANQVSIQPSGITIEGISKSFSMSIVDGLYVEDSGFTGTAIAAHANGVAAVAGRFYAPSGYGVYGKTDNSLYSAGLFKTHGDTASIKLAAFNTAALAFTCETGFWAKATTKDFYANGTGVGYAPFTGSHEGLIPISHDEISVGDIVCDKKLINIESVSNAICEMEVSSKAYQKAARGIHVYQEPLTSENVAAFDDEIETGYYALLYNLIAFNSLGEGAMNVCGQGGDLEIGDLIVTSDMVGKGMKQDDDIVRNYTVAECRQNVKFSSLNDVKQVAVIYRCG